MVVELIALPLTATVEYSVSALWSWVFAAEAAARERDRARGLVPAPLRFAVGQRVRCRVADHTWAAGRVVQLQPHWSASQATAPYQVMLDDYSDEDGKDTLVWAPADDDRMIRAAAGLPSCQAYEGLVSVAVPSVPCLNQHRIAWCFSELHVDVLLEGWSALLYGFRRDITRTTLTHQQPSRHHAPPALHIYAEEISHTRGSQTRPARGRSRRDSARWWSTRGSRAARP